MTVSVSVVRGKSIQSSRKLPGASDGKVVRIEAIAEGQYLLTEQDTGVGPENITVKRVGSDLHVALQGTEPDQPELIIEGFFDLPGQLIGLAEDGAYYGYIAVDGEADHEAAFLLEEMSSPLALGYPSVVGFGDGLVAAASVLPGALLGMGALVGGALIDHNRDSGGRVPEVPMPANNGIGSVVDDQGPVVGPLASGDVTDDARPTFSGGGQRPGEKVVIRDGDSVIGDAIVDANGNWSFTPDKPLREGEHILSTVVIDQNGTHSPESDGFVVTVDTTAPASGGVSGAVDNKGTITGPIGNGGVTDDDQPTLSGVGTPGDTISIIDNGEVIGEVVVDEEGSWTFTPEQPLAEGEHVFEVVVTDPAGNSSDPSEEFVVVIDTTPPSAGAVGSIEDNKGPITGPIGNGGVTDDDQPTLSGAGTPGDTISIIDNGEVIGEVVVDEEGSWAFTPEQPLAEGEHVFEVVVTDPAGNSSDPSEEFVVVIDTTPPSAGGVGSIEDNKGPITGPIGNGGVTDDDQPTLSGVGTPGDTISIIDNGEVIGEVVVDEEGSWTFTPEQPLAEGEHVFEVVVTDPAGNNSDPSEEFVVVIDTTPPSAGGVESIEDNKGAITGPIGNGGVTDDDRPTLSGVGTPGDTISILDNGEVIGEVVVDEEGSWTFTPEQPLAEGEHVFEVVVTDPAGNSSDPSEEFVVVIDTTPPSAGAVGSIEDNKGAITGPIGNGGVTDDDRPTLSGVGMPGDTISIIDNGEVIGEVVVDEEGSWTFTPEQPLAEGEHVFEVVATDPAGNSSDPSEEFVVSIDTTPPNAAIEQIIDDEGRVLGPIANGGLTDDARPTLSGKGDVGDTVAIFDNGQNIGEVEVGSDGTWAFTPNMPLQDGDHAFSIVVTDQAGNSSGLSEPHLVIIDATPPEKPAITQVYDDQGDVTGNLSSGDATDDSKPTLSGTAEANSTVIVRDNGVEIGRAPVDAQGNWSFEPTLPLGKGLHGFTVEAVDAAGNTSVPSERFELVLVNDEPPAAPAITAVVDDVGSLTGTIQKNGITDDARPEIQGTAQAGMTVTVYIDNVLVGTTVASAKGEWSFTPGADLADGLHAITATATNAVGNISPETGAYPIRVDTQAPGKPGQGDAQLLDDAGPITGAITSGSTTDDNTPTFTGRAEPNSTVVIYDSGKEIGRVGSDADGDWHFTPAPPLAEGAHSLSYTVIDQAGNVSPPADAIDFTVDTSSIVVSIDGASDDAGSITGPISKGGVTDDTTPTLHGKATAGGTVTIYEGSTVLGTVLAGSDGSWRFTPDTALSEGHHTLTATVTTPASGESAASAGFDFRIDVSAPATPSIDSISDDVGSLQGLLAQGADTDDTTPTLAGRAEAGSTVRIHDNGSLLGSVTADASGNWSYTPGTPLNNGTHSFTVTAQDSAGNLSSASEPYAITIDTVVPTQPAITQVYDDQGDVTGNLSSGDATDDSKPTLSGTAEANSTVIVRDNGVEIGRAPVDAQGNWSFEPTLPLGKGPHGFTVEAVDAAGNTSVPSERFELVLVNDEPPAAPAITAVVDDVGSLTGTIQKNGITDDARPEIQGTAQAGMTVTVYIDNVLVGTTVASAKGEWSFTPGADLADGLHAITATATNAVGNISPETGAYPIRVDTQAPGKPGQGDAQLLDDAGPITGAITSGSTTDDNTPTFTGKVEGNATVVIHDGGKEIGRVGSDADGNWHFTPAPPLAEGAHSLSYTVIDQAGNVSPPADAIDFTVDTSSIVVSIDGASDDAGSITGPISKGGVTDDTTPTLHGKATAGGTVTIYEGSTVLGTVLAGSDGSWRFTPDTALSEGHHTLTATVTTPASGESAASAGFDFRIDASAPAVPSIDSISDDVGSLQGLLARGADTDDTTPTLAGRAEAGSTVRIHDNGSLLGSVTADASGNWSYTPGTPLNNGTHSFTVTAQDAAGNLSPLSDPYAITIDTVVPTQPVITQVYDDQGDDTGNLSSGDATDDSKPTLSGTAEANSTVIVRDNGVEIGRAPVDAQGNWSFEPTLPLGKGPHGFTVEAVDAAGNTSVPSERFELVLVNDEPPAAPAITAVVDDVGSLTGTIQKNGITDDARPEIQGTAQAGMTVTVYIDNVLVGTTVASAKGEWSFTPGADLADGLHAITATATNAVGNISPETGAYPIRVDTQAPGKPGQGDAQLLDDAGPITGAITSGSTTDDNTPTFTGKVEGNATVVIHDGGKEIGRVASDADGNWHFTPAPPLAEGAHSLSYTVIDQAGNVSPPADAIDFTVDTSSIVVSIDGASDDAGSITGPISKGGVTDDTTPTLHGKATAGGTVTIYEGSTVLGTVRAGSDGSWRFTPDTALSEGHHTLTATVTTPASGESAASTGFDFRIDASAPATPSIDSISDDVGSLQGLLAQGADTDDTTPTLAGRAEAGSTVRIHDNGSLLGSVTADASGNWSYTPGTPLNNGTHSFTVTAQDSAGNLSPASEPYAITIDTVAPGKPSIEIVVDDVGSETGAIENGSEVDDAQPDIYGRAEAGSTVIIRDNGVEIGRVTANAEGEWRFTPAEELSEGQHQFTVEAVDLAGNTSVPSDAFDMSYYVNGDDYPDELMDGAPRFNAMVAIDTSGSMNGVPLANVKLSLRTLADEYLNAAKGEVVTLTLIDMSTVSPVTYTFASVQDAGYASYLNALNKLSGSGAYNYETMINKAMDSIQSAYEGGNGPSQIFVLGDGQNPLTVGAADRWQQMLENPTGSQLIIPAIQCTPISFAPLQSSTRFSFDGIATGGEAIDMPSAEKLPGIFLGNTVADSVGGNVLLNDSKIEVDGNERLTEVRFDGGVFRIGADNILVHENVSSSVESFDYKPDSGLLTIETTAGWLRIYVHGEGGAAAGSYTYSARLSQRYVGEQQVAEVFGYTAVGPDGRSQAANLHIAIAQPDVTELIEISNIGKDSVSLGDFMTANGDAGREVSGAIRMPLGEGMQLQVSVDGGQTWGDAQIAGRKWVFMDMTTHTSSWDVQVRVTDGIAHGTKIVSQHVEYMAPLGKASIASIPDADGIYKTAEAADGSEVVVSIAGTGAQSGDTVHVQWGVISVDYTLGDADIAAGFATVNIPSNITSNVQTAAYDFSVTAQVVGKGGAIGPVSDPYEVVGNYKKTESYDSLQGAVVDNAYAGSGFAASTDGTMAMVGSSAIHLAGMKISGEGSATATFAMDGPRDTFSLTLTGIDNELGAMIEVFDVEGNLVHSESFVGGTDAHHTKLFSFKVMEVVGGPGVIEVGSFKVTSFGPSITLSGLNMTSPKHIVDARPADQIEYMSETYYGSDGDDIVSLALWPTTYFAQDSAAIHGGGGVDELRIAGGGYPLDMKTAIGKISSMEIINLTGTGNNTLTLNLRNVIDNGGVDLFYQGDQSRVQMMIKGNPGDAVMLSDVLGGGIDMGDWMQTGSVVVNGSAYVSYQHSGLAVELLVQSGVVVTLSNTEGPAGRSTTGVDTLGADVLSDALTIPFEDIPGVTSAVAAESGTHGASGLRISGGDLREGGLEAADALLTHASDNFTTVDGSLAWLSLQQEEARLHMS